MLIQIVYKNNHVHVDILAPLLVQVTLPVAITPRKWHSAVVFGDGPTFRVVVLFGGNNSSHDLSETTLLLLGSSPTRI